VKPPLRSWPITAATRATLTAIRDDEASGALQRYVKASAISTPAISPQDGNDDLQMPQQQLKLVVGHRGLVRLIRRWAIHDAMRGMTRYAKRHDRQQRSEHPVEQNQRKLHPKMREVAVTR
jgi:hypothetical protein